MNYYSDPEPNYALYIIIGLVIDAVLACATAYIAKGKGREPLPYGLLGFFLPIIGLIIVLVQEDLSGNQQTATSQQRIVNNPNAKKITVPIQEWYLDLPFEILQSTTSISPNKDSVYLNLNMLNIGEKPIRSVYFRFKCYDDTGDELTKEGFYYAYQDMEINPDREFGKYINISLTDFRTRNVEILFEKMAFTDGSVITKNDIRPKEPLMQGEAISDPDLTNLAFARHCGGKENYRPQCFPVANTYDKWLCTCGRTNINTGTCYKCGRTISQNRQLFSAESISQWKHQRESVRAENKLKERERTKKLAQRGMMIVGAIVVVIISISIYKYCYGYKDLAGRYGIGEPKVVAYILNSSECETVQDTDCIIEPNGDISFMDYNSGQDKYVRVHGHLEPSDTEDYSYGIAIKSGGYTVTKEGLKYRYYFDVPDPYSEYDQSQYAIWNDVGFLGSGSYDIIKDKHVTKTNAVESRIDAKAENSIGDDMSVEVFTRCEYCDKYAVIQWEYNRNGTYKYCYMCEQCEKNTRQEILNKLRSEQGER